MTDAIPRSDGQTATERSLKRLAERSFLSLWSYAGIYRDQGIASGRDGKEVCDLLVVFHPHILIFSDKECRFPESGDLPLRWRRWFRRAVLESAKQVWGAERWISQHPDRLFLDRCCVRPFPFPLPRPDEAIFHRIVVAHDDIRACREFLGGSGSFMLMPDAAEGGAAMPFVIGDLDPSQGFVHVLDDTSLDIVLSTLDTIADFVRYLERKERFVRSGRLGVAAGEEELLAYYLKDVDAEGHHDFIFPAEAARADHIILDEGHWEDFVASPQRQAQIKANKISYAWDRLIERFGGNVLAATLAEGSSEEVSDHERLLRELAREDRTRRRSLAQALISLLETAPPDQRSARVVMPLEPSQPVYVFLLFPHPPDIPYEQYRAARRHHLQAYFRVIKMKFPETKALIGIAMEPSTGAGGSEDAMYYEPPAEWTTELQQEAEQLQRELNILLDPKPYKVHVEEYPPTPVPFTTRVGRNERCPCGSGTKFKKCCGDPRRRHAT